MENFPQTNFPQNEELRGGQHEGMEGKVFLLLTLLLKHYGNLQQHDF
jgi:hypothetical protein